MNLEKRLKSAADELKQSARSSSPPPLRPASELMRPWMAFAAAFAVVLAVVGVPYVLTDLGQGTSPDAGPLAGIDTTTTVLETTTSGPACEAGDLYPPTTLGFSDDNDGSDPRDLTEPVKDKLTRIAEAAAGCDASGLAALASPDITTTFGPGSGPEDIASWSADDERFQIIAELFNMTHAVITEMADGSALYVWPAAFAYDAWDEIPDDLVAELLRIHTQEDLDTIAEFGSYAGWRMGITEAGEWIFFVAGD